MPCRQWRWKSLGVFTLACPALACAATAALNQLTLEQAFELLEQRGSTILYSSDLIRPDMRVRQEPASDDARDILTQIVSPYGLEVADGPDGAFMLVRARPPASGSLIGTLRHEQDGRPLAGLAVQLGADGPLTSTDLSGHFRFQSIPPGRYALQLPTPLLRLAGEYVAVVRPARVSELHAAAADVVVAELTEVTIYASHYELIREPAVAFTSLTTADLQLLPDVGDDPLRSISRLPGAGSGDFTAKVNMRGGEADEALVRFAGLRLYNPFHFKDFQSLFSTIDPAIISAVEVHTGGFPSPFGDRMSGVIDIAPMTPKGRLYGEISMSLFNTAGLATGAFGDGAGDWLLSARRSNLDLTLDLANRDVGQPRYSDFHGRVSHRISDALAVTANVLAFDDAIELHDRDREEQASADYHDEYLWLRLDYRGSDRLGGSMLLGRTRLNSERAGQADQPGISRGTLDDRRDFSIDSLQLDGSWQPSDRLYLQFGGDWRVASGRYDYHDEAEFDLLFATPGAWTEPTRNRTLHASPRGDQYGAYWNLRAGILADVIAEAGLRWDKNTLTQGNDERWSPRFSVMRRLGERIRLRAGWGRYHQAQAINELQIPDGVTQFFPSQQADQLLAGIEYQHPGGTEFRLEAYEKDYHRIRPRFENLLNGRILLPELKPDRIRIAPDSATARGVELSLRRHGADPWGWWLNYAWSTVTDETEGAGTPRSWAQKHALGAGLTWTAGGWEISLAGRYHSGWPTTAVTLAETDSIPVAVTGPRNAERLESHFSLDVRAARRMAFESAGTLTVFLEASNVTNHSNPCCVEYEIGDEEDAQRFDVETLNGLPLLPSLGFVWQF